MKAKLDILLWPVDLGLAPVRKLGQSARLLASSSHVSERLQNQAADDARQRDVLTALSLGNTLKGRMEKDVTLGDDQREQMRLQLDDTAKRLGHMIINASSTLDVTIERSAQNPMPMEV